MICQSLNVMGCTLNAHLGLYCTSTPSEVSNVNSPFDQRLYLSFISPMNDIAAERISSIEYVDSLFGYDG